MSEIEFFRRNSPLSLADVVTLTGTEPRDGTNLAVMIHDIAPLDSASSRDLAFLDNPAYASQAETTLAGVIITSQRFVNKIPENKAVLLSKTPYRAYAAVAAYFYPSAMRPTTVFDDGVSSAAHIHPSARLEVGVKVDPGAVIGEGAEIGAGSSVAANAVIGPHVRIGRQCSIGPGCTILNTLMGNRVIVHGGVRTGQDGFGFAMGAGGHFKVPQIGRVIIQDDVEIGAGTTIDRGASRDTIVGEGTKIDNLVQIGHNVVIGRHCVIVSQVGISGSTVLEDYVVLGGQVGVVGHVRIGEGSQIAGSSNVASDVPPGSRWGGTPAKPIKDWFREIHTLKNMSQKGSTKSTEASE